MARKTCESFSPSAPHTMILKHFTQLQLLPTASFGFPPGHREGWLLSTATEFQPEAGKRFIWNGTEVFEALYNFLILFPFSRRARALGDISFHMCRVLYVGRKITVQGTHHRNPQTQTNSDSTRISWLLPENTRPNSAESISALLSVVPLTG